MANLSPSTGSIVIRSLDRPGAADDISAYATKRDEYWVLGQGGVAAGSELRFALAPGRGHELRLDVEVDAVVVRAEGDFFLTGSSHFALRGDHGALEGFRLRDVAQEAVSVFGDHVAVIGMIFERCGPREPRRAWQGVLDVEPGARQALIAENHWIGSYSTPGRIVQGAAADGEWADHFVVRDNLVEDDQPIASAQHLRQKVAGFQMGQGNASDHGYGGQVVGNRVVRGSGQSTLEIKGSDILLADNVVLWSPKMIVREGEGNSVLRNLVIEPRNDAPAARGFSRSDREAAGIVIRSSDNVVAYNVVIDAHQDAALAITWGGRDGAPVPKGNLIHDNTLIQRADQARADVIGFPRYAQPEPPFANFFENNLVIRTSPGRLVGSYGRVADDIAALQDWGSANLFFHRLEPDPERGLPAAQFSAAAPMVDVATGEPLAADPLLVDRGRAAVSAAPPLDADGKRIEDRPDIGAYEWPLGRRSEGAASEWRQETRMVDDRADAAALGLLDAAADGF